jgi:hypothetical protein
MNKVVRLGCGQYGNVFCSIKVDADGRLSICGVEGPMKNGNACGGCGQIKPAIIFCSIKVDADGKLCGVEGPMKNGNARGDCGQIKPAIVELAPAWTQEMLAKFQEIWDRWHLNDMRAGCEHQRAEQWDKRPIDPSKPLNSYGKHYVGQKQDSWNMLTWLNASEHPDGLMCKPCLVCGYKYGTAWLKEEVPQEVINWLANLPETDMTPAWV